VQLDEVQPQQLAPPRPAAPFVANPEKSFVQPFEPQSGHRTFRLPPP